jgi:hypothetical protein
MAAALTKHAPYFYGLGKYGIANLKSDKQRSGAAALPAAADMA